MWIALPYGVLAGTVVLTAATARPAPAVVLQIVAVSVAVAAWHAWWVVLHPQWLEARLLPMALYFVGLLALTDHLTELSFTFFALQLVCYPMAFVALPGVAAYAGVAATTAVSILGSAPRTWTLEQVSLAAATAALVGVAGGAIRALEAETAGRHAALAALAAAHADLQRALDENLGLQERLLAEARAAGVAGERTRLAGEIHDTLAAGLAGILTQLEALDAQLGPEHELHRRVRTSTALARECLRDARRSVHALRPSALDRGTLPAALAEVAAQAERTHQLPVRLHVVGEQVAVSDAAEDVLVRAAQEALTNVGRHARASAAHLTLSYLVDALALDVSDDGVGLSADLATAEGHGLRFMRERVDGVAGRLELRSSGSTGTTVTVTVPAQVARR
ncbi:sensor histidine kinase [Nocardioides sp. L-11A]|uniref:sensor histidine kinase n=1 Tax=Nocardioides sp. L-11A TaxID=3043848 RepID=UPI00249C9414|nr:histidine kinase [Nocardioides sp. L-11A]